MRGKTARDLTEAEIREIAVRYLSRREYGVEELRQKLLQRGADSAIADTVVSDLAEENLVSDERFTEMYVRMRIRRLFGPLKIGEKSGSSFSSYSFFENDRRSLLLRRHPLQQSARQEQEYRHRCA